MTNRFQTKLLFVLGLVLFNTAVVALLHHIETIEEGLTLVVIATIIAAILLFFWISNMINAEVKEQVCIETAERTRELSASNELLKKEIEEKKKIEKSLEEYQHRLQFLADTTGDVLYRLKYDTMQYDYVNSAIQILTGYTQEEINEMGFKSIVLEHELHKLPHNSYYIDRSKIEFEKCVTEYSADYLIRRKDGTTIWVGDHSYPWRDSNGKVIGSVGVLQNISRRKNSELELMKEKEKAEKSDRLKTDFLTQMSHEIRTPLNTMLNYTSLVKEEIENNSFESLPAFFEIISEAGLRLTRTIDLILNMSQIQTGTYEPNFRIINLEKDILNQLTSEYCIRAAKKGLKLNYNQSGTDARIEGDNYTITQIFDNLINNAVKYTHTGFININVFSHNGSLCVDVQDSGIGITKEYIPSLFSPFSQEEMGYSRRYEGNGLGLALVKKYVELNRGTISVESEKDKGTLFRLTFRKLK